MYLVADVKLLERIEVYDFDYIDSLTRLDEPALPLKERFFNKLGLVECTQTVYVYVQHISNNFHCQNLKEYMAFYLLNDICMLANVFQAFRQNSLNEHQLDRLTL